MGSILVDAQNKLSYLNTLVASLSHTNTLKKVKKKMTRCQHSEKKSKKKNDKVGLEPTTICSQDGILTTTPLPFADMHTASKAV